MTTQPGTPLSTLNPMGSAYPLQKVFEVTTDGTNSVDFWKIPKGTSIEMVLMEIRRIGTGAASNITIGDGDDADGFILDSAVCGAVKGAIFGDAAEERGKYLYMGDSYHSPKRKTYVDADKVLKLKASVALTIEAIVRVYVFGHQLEEA